jgi:hypothetical protein
MAFPFANQDGARFDTPPIRQAGLARLSVRDRVLNVEAFECPTDGVGKIPESIRLPHDIAQRLDNSIRALLDRLCDLRF